MEFSTPMVRGTLKKRYKRFLADVLLENGQVVTAHCPNTGSMKTCGSPGDQIILSHNPSPKRKLDYSWEYTVNDHGFIGINTQRPNQVVFEALQKGLIGELSSYDSIHREVKYHQNSRIDFLLKDSKEKLADCYLEVKNATLEGPEQSVLFPDAVTARGQKHLRDLTAMKQQGFRAILFFFVNRPNILTCEIAKDIDPIYYEQLGIAIQSGVEVMAYSANSSLGGITISSRVPFIFPAVR